jgi:hypothetical protein
MVATTTAIIFLINAIDCQKRWIGVKGIGLGFQWIDAIGVQMHYNTSKY